LPSLTRLAQIPVLLLFTLHRGGEHGFFFFFGSYWVFHGRLDVKNGHKDNKKCVTVKRRISRTKQKLEKLDM
jgi:hypothetical protein